MLCAKAWLGTETVTLYIDAQKCEQVLLAPNLVGSVEECQCGGPLKTSLNRMEPTPSCVLGFSPWLALVDPQLQLPAQAYGKRWSVRNLVPGVRPL